MITLHRFEQNSPEWRGKRDGLYTGSNAHKLFKFGKIEYAKTAEAQWGGNFYTRRGHILEDEAIALYEQIYGIKVDRPGFVTNDKYPECGYSPDALRPDRTIEVKAFNEVKHLEVAEYVPLEILAQTSFGQIICEKKLCDLLLYNPDLPADKALIIITLKLNRDVERNFKRIMKGKV